MTRSLLGFYAGPQPTGLGQLIDAGAALVLGLDDMGVLVEAEQKRPGIIKIARFFVPNITAESGRASDPVQWAHWYVAQFQSKIDANRAILQNKTTWLCGPNEPIYKNDDGSTDKDGLRWLVAFEAERIRIMAAQGIQCAVFNFSTGYPPIADLDLLAPIISLMIQCNSLFALHGYSAGDMGLDGDNTNRHEEIHERWPSLRIVYTEWAANYPWNIPGLTEDVYAQWFESGDVRLKRTAGYLAGVAVYLLGGTDDWIKFRLGPGMVNRLVAYLKMQTGGSVPPPVVIPPPVVVPPVPSANLLANPDLFTGGFSICPGHLSTNVPNGWDFHAEEGIGPDFPDSPAATPWGVPSAVYHSIDGRPGTTPLPASEHALYFNAADPVVWHLSLRYGKQWWKLSQTIPNLPAGQYQFTGELYPDIYTGNHVWATDPHSGQWNVKVPGEGDTVGIGNFGKWNKLDRTLFHQGGDKTIALQCIAPFGVEVVGWFVRGLSLTRIQDPMQLSNTGPATVIETDSAGHPVTFLNMREFGSLSAPILERLPAKAPLLMTGTVTVKDSDGITWAEVRSVKHGAGWASIAYLKQNGQ